MMGLVLRTSSKVRDLQRLPSLITPSRGVTAEGLIGAASPTSQGRAGAERECCRERVLFNGPDFGTFRVFEIKKEKLRAGSGCIPAPLWLPLEALSSPYLPWGHAQCPFGKHRTPCPGQIKHPHSGALSDLQP